MTALGQLQTFPALARMSPVGGRSQQVNATLYLKWKDGGVVMVRRFRRGFTSAEKTEMWDCWQRGESLSSIGRAFGKQSVVATDCGEDAQIALVAQADRRLAEANVSWRRETSRVSRDDLPRFDRVLCVRDLPHDRLAIFRFAGSAPSIARLA